MSTPTPSHDTAQPLPKPWIRTPLLESAALSRVAGCRIFLKLENLQPSSSFKSRGIGALLLHHIRHSPPSTPLHFISSSNGNAGLACVTAARALGFPASVIVSHAAKDFTIAKLYAAGAFNVVQWGETWADADRYLREVMIPEVRDGGEEPVYVPAFEDERIWEGVSSMVDEIKEQLEDVRQGDKNAVPGEGKALDAIVCSVGGGGLFTGIMRGIDRNFGTEVSVLAVETAGADSLNQSLRAGELVTLPAITSIAMSLGATRVSPTAFQQARREHVRGVVLEDQEAAMGCWRFADDERFLVEVSCGASLALCYDGKLKSLLPHLTPQSKVVIVVCGGSNITLDLLAEYKKTYGEAEEVATKDPIVPSTQTATHISTDTSIVG